MPTEKQITSYAPIGMMRSSQAPQRMGLLDMVLCSRLRLSLQDQTRSSIAPQVKDPPCELSIKPSSALVLKARLQSIQRTQSRYRYSKNSACERVSICPPKADLTVSLRHFCT